MSLDFHYKTHFMINIDWISIIFGTFISLINCILHWKCHTIFGNTNSKIHITFHSKKKKKMLKQLHFNSLNFFSMQFNLLILRNYFAQNVSGYMAFRLYYTALFIINIDFISLIFCALISLLNIVFIKNYIFYWHL